MNRYNCGLSDIERTAISFMLQLIRRRDFEFSSDFHFYRAACNADAVQRGEFCLSVRPSVCPSVCLSVTRVIPDKTEERSVQIFIPYEKIFILVF